MKQFLYALASGLIIFVFGYYFNVIMKSPDLRYQLSSPIEVDSSGAGRSPTVVQQVEIANTGKAVALKVQIKIRKAVGTIRLAKDSESDRSEQFRFPPEGTELDYDSLRPAGRIKISLSGGGPIAEQDLDVRDLDGPAKSALTAENPLVGSLRGVIIFAPMVLFWLWWGREMIKESFILKCRIDPIAALEAKKPVLFSRERWVECLHEYATPRAAKEQQYHETRDVSSWQIYRLLNSGKPNHLPDDIWAKVLPGLIDGFISRLTTVAQRSV